MMEPIPNHIHIGTVAGVHDGDTLKVLLDLDFDVRLVADIRLLGVYAPEMGKDGGEAARVKLMELCPPGAPLVLETVRIRGHEARSFTRYVGRVWAGGVDVCDAMNQWIGGRKGIGAPPTTLFGPGPAQERTGLPDAR